MQFVFDPALLGPPEDGDARKWIEQIQKLAALVDQRGLTATSPKVPRDQVIASWWSNWETKEGLAGFELARMAEEVSARLSQEVPSPRSAPLLDEVSIAPVYTSASISGDGVKDLEVHFAEAACAGRDGADQLGVLSPDECWAEPAEHILVEGEVLARHDPDEELVEDEREESAVREFMKRSREVHDLYSQCYELPCALIQHLELGIRATYLVGFNGDPDGLKFQLAPSLRSSLKDMNYRHLAGNARRCLRLMTLIAAGRGHELQGHEERVGKGPNDEILRVDGDPVIRTYIANHTPNAHRLFWIRRPTPVLLNVTGHEGRPAIVQ